MHRLLQGEVGSGKTIVALRAMLAVIDSGGQAALLAPTEVLAAQHHRSITRDARRPRRGRHARRQRASAPGSRCSPAASRPPYAAQALLDAATGDAGIVVGTHALIQEHVPFFDLGLVVVDEQHRFGVEQRDALREQGQPAPARARHDGHADPAHRRDDRVRRHGDLDADASCRAGARRSPPTSCRRTTRVGASAPGQRVAEEVRPGHQAYVVCPRIGDDAQEAAPDAGAAASRPAAPADRGRRPAGVAADRRGRRGRAGRGPQRELRERATPWSDAARRPALAGLRIEVLHGRLAPEDKDAVMRAFAAGEIDVLVSTTVIEVGVDVPNATVMVVMDADRFGVSQLHQLRGRVGRGAAPGLCLLMTETEPRPLAGAPRGRRRDDRRVRARPPRPRAAPRGRRARRPPERAAARQLRLLRLLRDEDLILQAREDAFALVDRGPGAGASTRCCAQLVASALDEEQAAYLERG